MRVLLLLIVGMAGCGDNELSLALGGYPAVGQGVSFNPDGKRVVSRNHDNTVKGRARPESANAKSSNRLSGDEWLRVVGKEIRTSPGAVYYPADQVFLGMGVAHPRTSQLPYGSDEPVARFVRERHYWSFTTARLIRFGLPFRLCWR